MNANDVITIGRSRSRHASSVASRRGSPASRRVLGELDDQDRVLARQADQHHEADLREDVDVLLGDRARRRSTLSRHIGTTRITASGSDQLSYCAASTRKTITTAKPKTIIAGVARLQLAGRSARSTRRPSTAGSSCVGQLLA